MGNDLANMYRPPSENFGGNLFSHNFDPFNIMSGGWLTQHFSAPPNPYLTRPQPQNFAPVQAYQPQMPHYGVSNMPPQALPHLPQNSNSSYPPAIPQGLNTAIQHTQLPQAVYNQFPGLPVSTATKPPAPQPATSNQPSGLPYQNRKPSY